jgi:hypothetical protein
MLSAWRKRNYRDVPGAMLFVLGMIPGLLAVLMRGLQNFSDHFSQTGGPIHRFQTDLGRPGDA